MNTGLIFMLQNLIEADNCFLCSSLNSCLSAIGGEKHPCRMYSITYQHRAQHKKEKKKKEEE